MFCLADFSLRNKLCAGAAAVLSLWGVLAYYGYEGDFQTNRDPYQIVAQYGRFEGLRAATPDDAVLGYVTDEAPGSVLAGAMFNAAQYNLVPRLLEKDKALDWTVGNFARPVDFAAVGRTYGLRVERDLGNGVILYRKEKAP